MKITAPVVGLTVPASVGMKLQDVCTPALIVDLDAFERNLDTMATFVRDKGVRLRAHAKTHKSADIARLQMIRGGACGICCQKVSEAEALVAGGVRDVLISNQVTNKGKIDRLAAMAGTVRTMVCVDDANNVDDLSTAAVRHGNVIGCLVEIDVGAGRCGVEPGAPAVVLGTQIAEADGLKFSGRRARRCCRKLVARCRTRDGILIDRLPAGAHAPYRRRPYEWLDQLSICGDVTDRSPKDRT